MSFVLLLILFQSSNENSFLKEIRVDFFVYELILLLLLMGRTLLNDVKGCSRIAGASQVIGRSRKTKTFGQG